MTMPHRFPPHEEHTPVMIREFEGHTVPFDADLLQTRLIGCFLAAGHRESVDLPQDIVLAVEYTLRNAPRNELVFGRGELERAVTRLLEEIGFPEVAKLYRSGTGTENELYVTPEKETLKKMLAGHLGVSGEPFEAVISKVMAAADKLGIRRAPAHLFLELARYYERELEKESTQCAVERTPEITLSRTEITTLVSPEARELCEAGILKIDGITTLFPCVHLFFRMEEFAGYHNLVPPVTELEIEPLLYETGTILSGVQKTVESKLDRPLPVILGIPDMFDFITAYADGERENSGTLASELGRVLCASFARGVYKLNLN
jgi:hypothetical protein